MSCQDCAGVTWVTTSTIFSLSYYDGSILAPLFCACKRKHKKSTVDGFNFVGQIRIRICLWHAIKCSYLNIIILKVKSPKIVFASLETLRTFSVVSVNNRRHTRCTVIGVISTFPQETLASNSSCPVSSVHLWLHVHLCLTTLQTLA